MKKITLILLIVNLVIQAYSQRIYLSNSHNPNNSTMSYVVDFLRLDSETFFSIGKFQEDEIKKVYVNNQDSAIIVTTKLLVVLNGELLSTSKMKFKLSMINLEDIVLITKIDKAKSTELYGKKGKNGVLVIFTKSPNTISAGMKEEQTDMQEDILENTTLHGMSDYIQ